MHGNTKLLVQLQVARRKVRPVAQSLRHLQNPRSRHGVDAGPSVQRAIDGPDRHPERSSDVLNASDLYGCAAQSITEIAHGTSRGVYDTRFCPPLQGLFSSSTYPCSVIASTGSCRTLPGNVVKITSCTLTIS